MFPWVLIERLKINKLQMKKDIKKLLTSLPTGSLVNMTRLSFFVLTFNSRTPVDESITIIVSSLDLSQAKPRGRPHRGIFSFLAKNFIRHNFVLKINPTSTHYNTFQTD